MGLFGAKPKNVVDNLSVVMFVAVASPIGVGRVHLLAQGVDLAVGQKGNQAGVVEREDPFVVQP